MRFEDKQLLMGFTKQALDWEYYDPKNLYIKAIKSNPALAAGIGTGAGAVGGLAVGGMLNEAFGQEESALRDLLIGAGIGAGVGGLGSTGLHYAYSNK